MTFQQREIARGLFLHSLFEQIERRVAVGMSFKDAVRRASQRRNARLFKRGALARKTLGNLYRTWRGGGRTPEILRRRYKPGRTRLPVALLIHFCDRLLGSPVISAHAVFTAMLDDWRRGIALPGLVSCNVRRKSAARSTAPEFPSYQTFQRALASGNAGEYRRRAEKARRAARELSSLRDFIEARRNTLQASCAITRTICR